MKKRVLLIPACILAMILGCFLITGHFRRNEVSDILASHLAINEESDNPVWISSSDTTYNWVHRSVDFSIGVSSHETTSVSAVFLFTSSDHKSIHISVPARKLHTQDETIFSASVSHQKLASGDWTMSVCLMDSDHHRIPLRNESLSDQALTICTFTVH